jgi:hypothetical protein
MPSASFVKAVARNVLEPIHPSVLLASPIISSSAIRAKPVSILLAPPVHHIPKTAAALHVPLDIPSTTEAAIQEAARLIVRLALDLETIPSVLYACKDLP